MFHADWESLGRKAGPIRNQQIVEYVDELVAFWDERSRGTLNTIALAVSAGRPVEIFGTDGNALYLDDVLQLARQRGVLAAMEKVTGR